MNRKMIVVAGSTALLLVAAAIECAAQNDKKNVVPYASYSTSFADLAYPAAALNAKKQGVVVIKATLDDEGNVVETYALSGSRDLIPDCLANAKKWKYKPNPEKVALVVYDFEIKGGWCHDASRSLFQWLGDMAKITACTQAGLTGNADPRH